MRTAPEERATLRRSWWLRGLAAAGLTVSAAVHVELAAGPWFADGGVTLAGLFVADAVSAALAALWVLLRGSWLAWVIVGLVAGSAVLALVVTTYVLVPAVGPLPAVYEPVWYAEKVVAAVAAGVAAVCAVIALAAPTRRG